MPSACRYEESRLPFLRKMEQDYIEWATIHFHCSEIEAGAVHVLSRYKVLTAAASSAYACYPGR